MAKYNYSINYDFKGFEGDTRIAVLKHNEFGDVIDWQFFETEQAAETFINEVTK